VLSEKSQTHSTNERIYTRGLFKVPLVKLPQ
jgi:hypothetical protein